MFCLRSHHIHPKWWHIHRLIRRSLYTFEESAIHNYRPRRLMSSTTFWPVDLSSSQRHCSVLFFECISGCSYAQSSKVLIYLQSIYLSRCVIISSSTYGGMWTCYQISLLVRKRQILVANSCWVCHTRYQFLFTTEFKDQWCNTLPGQVWQVYVRIKLVIRYMKRAVK